jgi:hypothetical protein
MRRAVASVLVAWLSIWGAVSAQEIRRVGVSGLRAEVLKLHHDAADVAVVLKNNLAFEGVIADVSASAFLLRGTTVTS